jgi:hypothetical protein
VFPLPQANGGKVVATEKDADYRLVNEQRNDNAPDTLGPQPHTETEFTTDANLRLPLVTLTNSSISRFEMAGWKTLRTIGRPLFLE